MRQFLGVIEVASHFKEKLMTEVTMEVSESQITKVGVNSRCEKGLHTSKENLNVTVV